jgi:hypothetical protein
LYWTEKQKILSKVVIYIPTKELKEFEISDDDDVSDKEDEYDDDFEVMVDKLARHKPFTLIKLIEATKQMET